MKRIVIVSGATGSLGERYLEYFSKKKDFRLVALSRREPARKIKNVKYLYSDLLDSKNLENEINRLHLDEFLEIIFIHPVGMFRFEEGKNSRSVDKKIYDSNVTTFINVANILSKLVEENRKLVFCCFGSVSDRFDIPYWKSYSQSKKELKGILKKLAENKNIRGVFVNVSSVFTNNESKLRPFADRTYWLKPEKIVLKSIKEIISGRSQFIELDVFEPNPDFKKNYYLNHKAIYEKWKKEMGQ